MHLHFLFLLPLIFFSYSSLVATTSSSSNTLTQGSSLFIEKDNHLVSPNRLFTAGFHQIGQNVYAFAIWYSNTMSDGNHTFVWMANRDEPVNGKRSKFSILKNGNLVLTDAGRRIWMSNTKSSSPMQLQLLNSGNLVLTELDKPSYLWQSFSFPTDTILPNQPFTKDTTLVSSRSLTNFSSGFYKLYFDDENIIRLIFNNDEIASVYWPKPWLLSWDVGRTTYNNSRVASLDSKGHFMSSDNFGFYTSDYGNVLQRRLTLDLDGNIRVYTLKRRSWVVSWQAISFTCTIHGICGPNSLCTYSSESGRRCTCMHGYKAKNHFDWSYGCEPTFELTRHRENYEFITLPFVEFYGFDIRRTSRPTFNECKNACLDDSTCKAFQFSSDQTLCYTKSLLYNGIYKGTRIFTYLKLPKTHALSYDQNVANDYPLNCSNSIIKLKRAYGKKTTNGSLKFMMWFSVVLGVIETTFILLSYYIAKQPSGVTTQTYLALATGFRSFTYDEIIKVTHKFRDEIGRGSGGIVYRGTLPDDRVVAIKVLHEAIQGEDEFLAEMSTIGRINHRNLIETYGYCAEGKHRILVYEYMESGSLAENLGANQLDWPMMLQIATGVAKGLAYLHEECLEWVLHCDVKPHNILLDVDYNPKVADFGLSKLFRQDVTENSKFSKIRGTRGYMAPEWVFNLPITSKVDVYSYGMVVLEMITGQSLTNDQARDDNGRVNHKRLISWLRDKLHEASGSFTVAEFMEISDPRMRDEFDTDEKKNLLKIALQCVEEDKDARPTMSEVVKMLLDAKMDN